MASLRTRCRPVLPAVLLLLACASRPAAFPQAQTQKRAVNLGAGKAGDVLKIPPVVWTNINSFVFLIGFDINGTPGAVNLAYAKRFREMKAYPALQTATQQWGRETFPLLQQLAAELSKPEIRDLLADLQAAFQRRKTDPAGASQEFARKLAELNRKFNALSQLSARVKQQFETLGNASQAAILEYRSRNFPVNPWVSIGPNLSDVQQALGLMNGQWNALLSDLQDLQRLLAGNRLDDVDIDVGLLTWEDITRTAGGFVAHLPQQRKYLSGDNYYDNCSFSETGAYLLKNSFLNSQDVVLGAELTGNKVRMMPRTSVANPAQVQWQFRKMGRGWWKLVNRARGEGFALDTSYLAATGGYSGQFWRCMPTEAPGWVRLINAFNGEMKSLDTYSDNWHAFMADTENRSGQYWRFVEAGLPAGR